MPLPNEICSGAPLSAQAALCEVTAIEQSVVVVVGAGPAGLRAAEVAVTEGARVVLCDAQPSAGRKFLVAGRGGLNLTHSESVENFPARYRAEAGEMARFIGRV